MGSKTIKNPELEKYTTSGSRLSPTQEDRPLPDPGPHLGAAGLRRDGYGPVTCTGPRPSLVSVCCRCCPPVTTGRGCAAGGCVWFSFTPLCVNESSIPRGFLRVWARGGDSRSLGWVLSRHERVSRGKGCEAQGPEAGLLQVVTPTRPNDQTSQRPRSCPVSSQTGLGRGTCSSQWASANAWRADTPLGSCVSGTLLPLREGLSPRPPPSGEAHAGGVLGAPRPEPRSGWEPSCERAA